MKKCSTCKETKLRTEFVKNKSRSDGLQSQCKPCKRKTQKTWYEANKKTHLANVKKRKKRVYRETRQFLWDYLLVHPCVDCGETDPIVLDFDHVRGVKLNNIAKMMTNERPRSVIEDEIAKCDVRCRNCHARRTAKQFDWYACIGKTPS